MTHKLLLDPQGGEGNGSSAGVAEAVKTLLVEKHNNDAMALARELLTKNRELEADNRKYRQKVAGYKESVPPEGSVVLKEDEAKLWEKYRALGDPATLKTSVEEGQAAKVKLEGIGRAETFRKAATVAGFDPEVFAELAESKGLKVEFKQETRDGKAVEVALVRGEGDSTTPIEEYAEKQLSRFLPALKQGQPSPKDRSKDTTPPRRPFSVPDLRPGSEGMADMETELIRTGLYQT